MRTESTHSERQRAEVVRWRCRRLVEAGFSSALAAALAADFRLDLHALLQLVERGCPPALAARIVAPAEDDPGASR
jgi:hypothetical protein